MYATKLQPEDFQNLPEGSIILAKATSNSQVKGAIWIFEFGEHKTGEYVRGNNRGRWYFNENEFYLLSKGEGQQHDSYVTITSDSREVG